MWVVLFIILVKLIIFLPETSLASSVPEGFAEYQVKSGDALSKIAPQEHWELIRKVNHIDERHLPIGKNILVPINLEKANNFLPVPKFIEETKDEQRILCIFLNLQYFGAYENGKLSFWGPTSSGKNGATPTGKFSAVWKTKFYRSKKYKADMPFAVNISSSGYFIHEQSLPGWPASHGCIRLLREDAKKIYHWIKKNDPIIISDKSSENRSFFYKFA